MQLETVGRGVTALGFYALVQEAETEDLCEFKASLVYAQPQLHRKSTNNKNKHLLRKIQPLENGRKHQAVGS